MPERCTYCGRGGHNAAHCPWPLVVSKRSTSLQLPSFSPRRFAAAGFFFHQTRKSGL